jgi:hypothetical protein
MSALQMLACSNKNETRLTAGLLAPIRALFTPRWPNSFTVFVLGWALLGAIFAIVYLALPQGFWNTYNGFKNSFVSFGYSLLLFAIIVFSYVILARDSLCEAKARDLNNLRSGRFSIGAGAALNSDAVREGILSGTLVRLPNAINVL